MYIGDLTAESVHVLDVVHTIVLRDRRIVVVGVVPRDEYTAVAILAELPKPLQPLVSSRAKVAQGTDYDETGRHQ